MNENWSRLKTAKPKTDLQPVPGAGRAFCTPLAKFQAEFIPLFKYLPKETLISSAVKNEKDVKGHSLYNRNCRL